MMITDWIEIVWKKTPWRIRRTIIRITQANFTVSAAAIITNEKGQVLLLDHLMRPNSAWGLPGGFLEHGEQPHEGITREIREETGLELEDLRMLRVRTVGSHVEILFTATTEGTPDIDTREIKGFGWFERNEFPERMNDRQKAMINRVINDQFEKTDRSY